MKERLDVLLVSGGFAESREKAKAMIMEGIVFVNGQREDKAGEGYVDFIFYPERKNADALILELKIDGTPEEAIRQIRDQNYALRFKGKLGEAPKYPGRILAVGISYDRKTKKHFCKVEVL